MTKRFLMIVAMLLWCSTGFAENINWNDMKKLHQKMDLKIGIKNHGNIVLSSKNKEFKNINPINDNATCEDFSLSFLPKKINIINII